VKPAGEKAVGPAGEKAVVPAGEKAVGPARRRAPGLPEGDGSAPEAVSFGAVGRHASATLLPPALSSADVLEQVASLLPLLAPSEQRVGRVILSLPASAAHLTITELASMAETSETTVVRFCRSLGFASYPELRIALAKSAGRATVRPVAPLAEDISSEDDLATVVAKVGAADAQAITATVAGLDLAELERVVDAVQRARRTDIYGVAASAVVAADLQQKLHRIGLVAFAWSDLHLALSSAANLSAGDVAIGISHSGTTLDTVEALAEARRTGATTVAITNYPRSPISEVASLLLRTTVSETTFRSGAMASRIAELAVVDCLFMAVAKLRYPETVAALARTRDAVRHRHRGRRR